ncbi:MAG TPA: tail fiber protein [Caulobacteraceae bacterium]|jgi:microcystin-dependent protein|nr:tail fiber protein [Caulobacteraceae bacterium]
MSDFYLGQIIHGAWNFAPRGTAMCAAQLLPISQNTALFSLLGTNYGGNGTTNFQLPDLRGRAAVNAGQGPGLSNYNVGQIGGNENATLTISNMPTHTHTFSSTSTFSASGAQPHASANVPATGSVLGHSVDIAPNPTSAPAIYCPSGTATPIALGGLNVAGTNSNAGGSQAFSILNPYLAITIVIALTGIYPTRS